MIKIAKTSSIGSVTSPTPRMRLAMSTGHCPNSINWKYAIEKISWRYSIWNAECRTRYVCVTQTRNGISIFLHLFFFGCFKSIDRMCASNFERNHILGLMTMWSIDLENVAHRRDARRSHRSEKWSIEWHRWDILVSTPLTIWLIVIGSRLSRTSGSSSERRARQTHRDKQTKYRKPIRFHRIVSMLQYIRPAVTMTVFSVFRVIRTDHLFPFFLYSSSQLLCAERHKNRKCLNARLNGSTIDTSANEFYRIFGMSLMMLTVNYKAQ